MTNIFEFVIFCRPTSLLASEITAKYAKQGKYWPHGTR